MGSNPANTHPNKNIQILKKIYLFRHDFLCAYCKQKERRIVLNGLKMLMAASHLFSALICFSSFLSVFLVWLCVYANTEL